MISSVLKRITKKKLTSEPTKDPSERIDNGLPFNLKIGSVITIDSVPFILNDGLTIQNPGATQLVKAYGSLKILGFPAHRFYLEDETGKEESVLEIIETDDELEIVLYRDFEIITPESADDWDHWLSEEDGYIGYPVFRLRGADENDLYDNYWGSDSHQSEPVCATETIFEDMFGENQCTIQHTMMLYSKEVGDIHEFALLSAEEDTEKETSLVRVSLGIPTTLQ